MGLFSKKYGRRVVNINECHIAAAWVSSTLIAVKAWWDASTLTAYHCGKNQGSLRHITFRQGSNTGDRMVILTVSGHPEYALQQTEITAFQIAVEHALAILPTPSGHDTIILRTQYIAKKVPTYFHERILSGKGYILETLHEKKSGKQLYFKISASSFFQPNSLQAERLYNKALELGNFNPSATVLDLYCGTGTLAIFASFSVKAVLGIELSPESAYNAQENCVLNGITNVDILCEDVGRALASLKKDDGLKELEGVIIDPPRSGLVPNALEHLIQLQPRKIVYISCNPTTQRSNIEQLLAAGYSIHAIQPVDQFPHTPHIENIILLQFACKRGQFEAN